MAWVCRCCPGLRRFLTQEFRPGEKRLLHRGDLVFQESVVHTNAKTPIQVAAPVRAATCQVNPSRPLQDKVRALEQPQRLGLLLVRFSLGG